MSIDGCGPEDTNNIIEMNEEDAEIEDRDIISADGIDPDAIAPDTADADDMGASNENGGQRGRRGLEGVHTNNGVETNEMN